MFSVVIPLYNKVSKIKYTIQSVLNQSFHDFEVIIVNDGSTDKSLEVVHSFNDYRIRIINQENGGVSCARNRGIKEAKYDWIAFLDADDLWKENKLELVNNTILNYHCKTWVITGFNTIYGKRTVNNTYKKFHFLNNVFDDLLAGLKIQTSAVIVKKDLFLREERLYFREGINNSEDREVWYKLACLDSSPFYLNVTLSDYIIDQSGNSLTSQKLAISKTNFLSMQERLNHFLVELNQQDATKLIKYIHIFNKKVIFSRWSVSNTFPEDFKKHLNYYEYLFLKNSLFLPQIIKKIIKKSLAK